jgi:hypothetical protein
MRWPTAALAGTAGVVVPAFLYAAAGAAVTEGLASGIVLVL